ncbi:MAG: hypothetical protein U9Q38_08635 [Thermodesulfobacteriota bacterium]|nr:hypothetical protein [Thermodesulfobacteriota bacterium]
MLPYLRGASRISDQSEFTIPDRVNNWLQVIDYFYTIHETHNFMGRIEIFAFMLFFMVEI